MTQRTSLRALTFNALRPGFLPVMARKAWLRLTERGRKREHAAAQAWCAKHSESLEAFAMRLAPDLWTEALAFDRDFGAAAAAKLQSIGFDMGGGGDSRLLYLLARKLAPEVVVETGVAAGFSSACLLNALAANGRGRLYSSDFPYFRIAEPERFIGVLVDQQLRAGWTLHLRGDRANLPRICDQVERIDLIHYDSDKSRTGRAFAMDVLAPRMTEKTVVVMDDIQDNLYFRDYATSQKRPWRVFASTNKYVGLIGL